VAEKPAHRQYTSRRAGITAALAEKIALIDGRGIYQGGHYKDRFLNVTVRCYVNQDDSVEALDELLEDVETVIEENSRLRYYDRMGLEQFTQQITVISIDTDEGVLDPLGVGELLLEVRY